MGERIVLEGATNFRCLGGYETADGRRVRTGRIYRSDGLHRLTDRDHVRLGDLGVRVVCDLRYGEEREREPSRLPGHLPIEAVHVGLAQRPSPGFVDSLDRDTRDMKAGHDYLSSNYREYPHLYAGAYRAVFDRLLALDEGALVFHCTAGKDRAGFTAAVVLSALGVPYETVLEDYLRTNELWDRGERVPEGWPAEIVDAIFSARPEYLATGFSIIESDFGSFDAYLTERVGLTREAREALRTKLLD